MTLLALVESLGGALNSPDVSRRKSGLEFLSRVLERLPAAALSARERHFLVSFFAERLRGDRAALHSAAVRGLHAAVCRGGEQALPQEDLQSATWTLMGT